VCIIEVIVWHFLSNRAVVVSLVHTLRRKEENGVKYFLYMADDNQPEDDEKGNQ
jgi:hypothetical protein